MMLESDIRPIARAVIRKGAQVLVQVKQADTGQRYLTLPGGGQEVGESLRECLRRECYEEIGVVPEIGDVVHVADVLKLSPTKRRHQIETLFACQVPDAYLPQLGPHPDKRQINTKWVDLTRKEMPFRPGYDAALSDAAAPVYLGWMRNEAP